MSAHNKVLDFIAEVHFAEHPFVLQSNKKSHEYDITDEIAPFSNGLQEYGKFSNLLYCRSLLNKLLTSSKTHRAKFLEYQCEQMQDPEKWLLSLEQFIEANAKELKRFKHQDFIEHITTLISESVNGLNSAELTTNEKLPKLFWKGSDIELLELILALTQSEKIVNAQGKSVRKEVTEFLQSAFNFKIKDAEKKILQSKARKKDITPFLNLLIKKYEEWKAKPTKK